MPVLKLPSVRTTQPQQAEVINWSNPLSKDIYFVLDTINMKDAVSGKLPTANHAKKQITVDGISSALATGNNHLEFPLQIPTSDGTYSGDFTIHAAFTPTAVMGAVIQTSRATSPYSQVGIYVNAANYNQSAGTLAIESYSGVSSYLEYGSNITSGIRTVVSVSRAGSITSVYRDGVLIGTGALTTSISGADATLTIGGGGSSDSRFPCDFPVHFAAVWNRALSPAEVKSLLDNPWQIFAPDQRRIFSVVSGGITLTMANITLANLLGNTSLTQQNALSVGNIAATNSLSNLSLAQQNMLATANIALGNALTNIVLSSALNLALANITEANVLTNVTIIQQNTLVIQSITEANVLTNTVLVQQNQLALANITESNILTNTVLTAGNSIAVGNISQPDILSTSNLGQQNTLVTQNIALTDTLANISLIQQNTLSIANIVITNALANILLTTGNSLVISSIVHSNTLGNINLVSQAILNVTNIAETNTLANLLLVQANSLSVANITEQNILGNVNLISSATLIVNNILHNLITTNITLVPGGVITYIVEGKVVYMLQYNSQVYIIGSTT